MSESKKWPVYCLYLDRAGKKGRLWSSFYFFAAVMVEIDID